MHLLSLYIYLHTIQLVICGVTYLASKTAQTFYMDLIPVLVVWRKQRLHTFHVMALPLSS